MEEVNNRSSGAVGDTKNELSKQAKEGGDENNNEQRRVSSDSRAVGNSSRGESKASESKTLTSVQLSESDFSAEFDESSHLLSEVPVEYSLALQPLQSAEELKGQVIAVHDESLKGITGGISAEVQIHLADGPSNLEVLPISVTQSIPNPPKQKLRPVKNGNDACSVEHDKQNSSDPKPSSIKPILKTPDGYNWRKYGQKQVKSPEGSRSYYRCTFSDCYAKKIECCDRSNCLIETVYRSPHTHDPPQKVNCTKESIPVLAIVPVSGINDTNQSTACSNDPVQANLSKQPLPGTDEISETKKQESSDSDETTEINMEEYVDGAECKKRQKRNSTGELESATKPGKKPKYVVHAAGDVGIKNSSKAHLKFDNCVGVEVSQISISSPAESPNTDGIHLQNSKQVNLHDSTIACGDDCVSIQTGCSGITIDKLICGPSHGISIGGLGEGKSKACVSNVTVTGCTITNSDNGVRIKTWQGGQGSVSGVSFKNIKVSNVKKAIVIDQKYCDGDHVCASVSGNVAISGVTFADVQGSVTVSPMSIVCGSAIPCTNIAVSGISLTGGSSPSDCENAFGEGDAACLQKGGGSSYKHSSYSGDTC